MNFLNLKVWFEKLLKLAKDAIKSEDHEDALRIHYNEFTAWYRKIGATMDSRLTAKEYAKPLAKVAITMLQFNLEREAAIGVQMEFEEQIRGVLLPYLDKIIQQDRDLFRDIVK